MALQVREDQVTQTVSRVVTTLQFIAEVGQHFAAAMPSVRDVIRNIEQEQNELKNAIRANQQTNPQVIVEINMLQREFQACVRNAKFFLEACKTMAEIGIDKEIEKAIDKELDQGKLNELRDFLSILLNEVEKCRRRWKVFTETYERVSERAKQNIDRYKEQADNHKQVCERAKRRHSVYALLSGSLAKGLQYGAGVAAATGLVCGRFGMTSPRTTALVVGGSAAALMGTWMFQHYPAIKGLHEKWNIAENSKEQQIFENAQKCVGELHAKLDKVEEIVEDMWRYVNQANEEITAEKVGLINITTLPDGTAKQRAIKLQLKNIRSSMNTILDRLGPEGERISSNPDEVISNTVSEQPRENPESTPDERNPLDVAHRIDTTHTSHEREVNSDSDSSLSVPVQVEDTGGTTTYPIMGSHVALGNLKEQQELQNDRSDDEHSEKEFEDEVVHKKQYKEDR